MVRLRLLFAVVALSLAAGCAESRTSPCPDHATATLAIGAGEPNPREVGFTELRDGDDLSVFRDPHGLWVSSISLRVEGLYLGDEADELHNGWPRVTVGLTQDGVDLSAPALYEGVDFIRGEGTSTSIWVAYEPDSMGLSFIGSPATLAASVTDSCGRTASGELVVVPRCHPDPDLSWSCRDAMDPPGCISCAAFGTACRDGCDLDATLGEVCAGPQTTLAISLSECVCAECATECASTCGTTGTDVTCGTCVQAAVTDGGCAAEASACLGA